MTKPNEDMKKLMLESSSSLISGLEAFIDSGLTNEVVKAIPAGNIALTAVKSPFIIKDYFFAKKVKRFLQEFSDTTYEQRNKFIDEIEKKPNLLTDIGITTMHYIEHCDDEVKSAILGIIYKLMIDETIRHEDGIRTCTTVLNMMLQDIIKFCNNGTEEMNNDQLLSIITSSQGLLTPLYDAGGYMTSPGMDTLEHFKYKHSTYGIFFQKFVSCALKKLDLL